MKLIKQISAATLPAATFISLALPAFAQDTLNPCEPGQANNGNVQNNLCRFAGTGNENNFARVIGNAITIILVLAAVIALFFLIWGGIKWILSGGDKGKVEAARGTIIAAIIGLVVTFLAYFILNVVLGLFGLNLTDLDLPDLTSPPN